jgi:LPS sulfotransferase NodH
MRHVVISVGRTGTELLCTSLSRHPGIQTWGELFYHFEEKRIAIDGRRYRDGEDPVAFLNEVVWPGGEAVSVGFKLLLFHMRNVGQTAIWDHLQARDDVAKILLHRANYLDIYLSSVLARQTGVWHAKTSAQAEAHRARIVPVEVDSTACVEHMTRTAAYFDWARQTFQSNLIEVSFDGLRDSFGTEMNRLVQALGHPPMDWHDGFARLNSRPRSEVVGNWDALCEALAGGPFEGFLEGA